MSKKECTCSGFVLQYEGSCQCGYEIEARRLRKEEEKTRIIKEFIETNKWCKKCLKNAKYEKI